MVEEGEPESEPSRQFLMECAGVRDAPQRIGCRDLRAVAKHQEEAAPTEAVAFS